MAIINFYYKRAHFACASPASKVSPPVFYFHFFFRSGAGGRRINVGIHRFGDYGLYKTAFYSRVLFWAKARAQLENCSGFQN